MGWWVEHSHHLIYTQVQISAIFIFIYYYNLPVINYSSIGGICSIDIGFVVGGAKEVSISGGQLNGVAAAHYAKKRN